MCTKPEFTIDGANFSTLEEFYSEVDRVPVPDSRWGHSLDAFHDILRGGFGTPDGGFLLRWRNVGETVFDWLIDIIRMHGAGGGEHDDGVELQLE